LGLNDAQPLEVIEQGIIYIDIMFGGVGIGWISQVKSENCCKFASARLMTA